MEDESDNSILVAQDSSDDDDEGDDDAIHDDDVDIGFRQHHVSRKSTKSRHKKTRQQAKDEAIYGVFLEDNDRGNSSNSSRWSRDKGQVMNKAPIFVAASKKDTPMEPPPTFHPSSSSTNTGTTPSSTPTPAAAEIDTQQDQDQKAADDYFQSLLQQAQDRKRKREAAIPPPSIPTSFASGPSDKPPPSTAASNAPSNSASTNIPVSKDPSVAKWEKHTKGIGSKLLAKMGWKGSGGLGSSRRRRPPPPTTTDGTPSAEAENSTTNTTTADATTASSQAPQETNTPSAPTSTGISQPIQVVVRPANMGLGFGNFKEMSQLKSNRQIEAEVRGIVLEKDKGDKKANESSSMEGVQSSAIPSTQQLLTQQVWKKRRRNKKQASDIVTPAQLVEASDVAATPTTSTDATISSQANLPLGQELLHNLTFLVQTQENQLYANTQMARSNRLHIQRLTDEVEDWKRQEQQLQQRREQLQTILDVIDRVQDAGTSEDLVYQALPQLHASLEEADRQALSFWSVLAPTLLSPTIQAKLDEWDPVASPHYWDDWKLEFPGLTREEDVQGLFTLQQSILQEQILPRVQQILESHRWDPTLDVLPVVELYQSLSNMALAQSKVLSSLDKSNVGHDDGVFAMVDESSATQDTLRRELLLQTIFPKLQQALHHWKPRLEQHDTTTGEMGLYRPLDRWILPWIPLLREMPAVLPSFVSECHRKLRMALAYFPRTLRGTDLVQCAFRTVQPWRSVLDSKALQRLSSEHISPVLSQVLVSLPTTLEMPPYQEKAWQLLWQGHRQAVVSDVDFLSLLEGELLRWADRMLEILVNTTSSSHESLNRVARSYVEWKLRLMEPSRPGTDVSRSTRCVREDARLCGILYSVLWMIQQATKDKEILNSIHLPTNGSYAVISARRGLELEKQVEENGIFVESRSRSEAEARLRLKRRDIRTPSFRDVVEEFAKGHGVLFQPRMGARALEDGKQVYLFGNVAIYLDGDVVFANKKVGNQNAWRPISMDQLLSMSVHSTD